MFSLIPWKSDRNGAVAGRAEHPVSLFRNEFDTLFDRFFGGFPGDASSWGLTMDETDNAVTLRMDAPGFEPGEFDIQATADTLRVTAERKADKDGGSFERRFQRAVSLPAPVDADKVEAAYRNGVLELTLPKAEQAKWKKIAVSGK
jgi:HSP20 family protein